MHLLIALKCPSSHSLFLSLGFYLESCYNLCHAIRFLSAGSGRERECRGGEGALSLANSRGRASGSGMCTPLTPEPADSAQPGTDQLAGQQAALRQPKSMDQKMGKNPPVEPGSDGDLAGESDAGCQVGLKQHLLPSLSDSVLSPASPGWEQLPLPSWGDHPCAGGEAGPAGEGAGESIPGC